MSEREDPPEDVSKQDLWERLRKLEQAVYPSRRDALKLGAGALLGGAGVAATTETATAADDSVGQVGVAGSSVDITLDEIKDPGGDVVADLDDTGDWVFQRGLDLPSVSADEVSHEKSHRHGAAVYYDPRDTGPYLDGADALADVPDGGLIRIAATDYDVATEGRLITDRPVTIEGEGWDKETVGTRLINTGGDAIDSPVIEFSNSTTQNGPIIRNLAVEHEGPNSPGVRLNNMTQPRLQNVMVLLNGVGQDGISYEGSTFYDVTDHCWVNGWTRHGLNHQANGSAHVIRDTHAVSSAGNTPVTALNTDAVGVWVKGGEWAAVDGIGIKLNNDGCIVEEGNFESSSVGIQIGTVGGSSPNTCFPIRNRINLENVTTGIRFANGSWNQAQFPVWNNAGAAIGDAYVWETGAYHCGAVHKGGPDRAAPYTDNGATAPYITYPVMMSDGEISAIETGVDIFVAMARDHESTPAVYDSSAATWKHLASATTSFTP